MSVVGVGSETSPDFTLLTPSEWTRFDLVKPTVSETWTQNLLALLPDQDSSRITEDFTALYRGLIANGVVSVFGFVQPVDDVAILATMMVNVFRSDDDKVIASPDEARNLIARADEDWDVAAPMITLHEQAHGWFLRAERTIDTSLEPVPWNTVREARYLFPHPRRGFVAILTCTSPNTNVSALFEIFDRVAGSFNWIEDDITKETRVGLDQLETA